MAVGVLWGIAAGGYFAEKAEGQRFVRALSALTGEGQGPPRQFERVREPLGKDVGLTEIPEEERLKGSETHGLDGAQRLLQQRDALRNPPRECIGVAQAPGVHR